MKAFREKTSVAEGIAEPSGTSPMGPMNGMLGDLRGKKTQLNKEVLKERYLLGCRGNVS